MPTPLCLTVQDRDATKLWYLKGQSNGDGPASAVGYQSCQVGPTCRFLDTVQHSIPFKVPKTERKDRRHACVSRFMRAKDLDFIARAFSGSLGNLEPLYTLV